MADPHSISSQNGWAAAVWAVCGAAVTASVRWLIGYIPRRQKALRDNDATLEEIRSKGVRDIIEDYKEQVQILRTELFEQGVRHAKAMADSDARYMALEGKYNEMFREFALLKSRMDGE